eukprot:gene6396-7051_t
MVSQPPASPDELYQAPKTSVFQKVVILLVFGTVVALSSLTASLPIEIVSHQRSQRPDAPSTSTIINGDTAWMIVATIFGLLAGPVLAYLYANIYGKSSNLLIQAVVLVASLVAFLWIIISLSLVWGVDANGDQIMGFPKQFYMFAHAGNLPIAEIADNIPMNIFAVFELTFAILAPAIVTSAVIDRVNIYGFLFFIFVWHLAVWTPIAHIVWNLRGFYKTNDIEDYAGGIVVHMMSAITVLATDLYLDFRGAPKSKIATPRNPETALFSSLAVWFLWFGVNAGKAHGANVSASQAVVNTIAGVTVAISLNYLIDFVFDVPFTNITLINAILLGVVSTTPSSGFVPVGGAMIISVITTLSVRLIANLLLKDGINDQPYSIVSVHGIGGSVAFLFTALISYQFVNKEGMNGLTYGHEGPIRHHTAAVLATWSCGLLAVFLCLFFSDFFVPLGRNFQKGGDYDPVPLGPDFSTPDAVEEPVQKEEVVQEPENTA